MEYPNCRETAPLNPLTMAPTVWDGDFIRWGKSFSFILHSFVIEGESDCDKCDCDKYCSFFKASTIINAECSNGGIVRRKASQI